MIAEKIVFPADYKERLHTLVESYAAQGHLLAKLLNTQCFFEEEGGSSYEEFSSRLLVELDEKVAQNSLLMDDLMFHLKIEKA